ncbi:hypothetical protein L3X38_038728 [Prunus dulcis]|uniref:Uncharacterized protein n=1 Tax=Prunus dulcis TaxID=3755 RepID=A0AAD4V5L6_PRUDU|nr:hypothetical protein L3X38_038728 [Prunus dulcis]
MGDHPGKLLRELPETKPCGLEASWELTGFGFLETPKLSELEAGAIPGWVTTLGSCFVSSQKQTVRDTVEWAQSGQYRARCGKPQLGRGLVGAHWLRVRRNSVVKRVGGWSNPRMGDPLGSCSVSSQKQILAGW